jgi:hypothetical protein
MKKKKKNRKEFLTSLFKGSILATFSFGFIFNKLLGITKNPKIYFRESPDSVKRNK